ncbi:MAG: hypothetical protein DMG31_07385 [Acidobacteria bacterium]|nr:MAG: hypothetical protein DMG31_07385 [Acidobacteriota bacterium]
MVEKSRTYQGPAKERFFTARLASSSAPDLLEINADLLWFRIEQRIRRAGALEMWNSLSVYCEQEASGALLVRVVIFNPDWDGPMQIAAVRSWPNDSKNLTPVACNLDHVAS